MTKYLGKSLFYSGLFASSVWLYVTLTFWGLFELNLPYLALGAFEFLMMGVGFGILTHTKEES